MVCAACTACTSSTSVARVLAVVVVDVPFAAVVGVAELAVVLAVEEPDAPPHAAAISSMIEANMPPKGPNRSGNMVAEVGLSPERSLHVVLGAIAKKPNSQRVMGVITCGGGIA